MNILEKIAEKTQERIIEAKNNKPLHVLKDEVLALPCGEVFKFEKSLIEAKKKDGIAFICEVKQASPSKGLITGNFDYINIAKEYQNAGAAAISVLTEPFFFKGANSYLNEISQNVQTPLLRKDFTIDEYQIYVARLIGASAVLLIASLLHEEKMTQFIRLASSLGLCSLVEAHTENEVQSALKAGAKILGVNNRDLKTFEVDLNTTLRLKKGLPEDVLFVSESGIKTPDDIKKLRDNGVSAVLIGETLMRSANKTEMINFLRGKN